VIDPDVLAYYESGNERDRLTVGWGRVEWARTWELITRFVPQRADVADVGGGPGGYAVPLALAGHRVRLLDAVPLHVEQAAEAARRAGVELDAVGGDARTLPYGAATADAVLLLGPLYHLLEIEERAAALAEARRVLRPGGVLLAAVISRFVPLLDGLKTSWAGSRYEDVSRTLETGRHTNPRREEDRFTTAHMARPDEFADEVAAAGFDGVRLLAVEGPASWLRDADAWMDDARRREWLLRELRRYEAEPSLLGASVHVMAVAYAP
jgi:SAM-dependent methyltransferase